jgi:hypothetical protein
LIILFKFGKLILIILASCNQSNYNTFEKLINGYFNSDEIRYTKVNDLRYEFRIPKDPSFNYSVCFSLDIGKI